MASTVQTCGFGLINSKIHQEQCTSNVYSSMVSHPYSIYIWHASHGVSGQPSWYEALQAFTEDDALHTANLIHMNGKAVIKVVRNDIKMACFPDKHTVELCERQIAKQKQIYERKTEDLEPEITFIDENDFSID